MVQAVLPTHYSWKKEGRCWLSGTNCFCWFRGLNLLVAVALVLLSLPSIAMVQGSSSRGQEVKGRELIGEVQCGCGRSEERWTHKFQVRRANEKECTQLKHRSPKELSSNSKSYEPFKVKVIRDSMGTVIRLTWDLKYLPRSKKYRIRHFFLQFTKVQKSISRSNRRRSKEWCFAVDMTKTKCRNKIRCSARHMKKRPRNLDIRLLYQLSGGRRGSPGGREHKYKVLKAALHRNQRRTRERRARSSIYRHRAATQPPVAKLRDCGRWDPNVSLRAIGPGQVTVTIQPPNPLGEYLELQLVNASNRNQLLYKHTVNQFKDGPKAKYTFTDVKPGSYRSNVRVYDAKKCRSASYRTSSNTVDVAAHGVASDEPGRVICSQWHPSVHLETLPGLDKLSSSPGAGGARDMHVQVAFDRVPRHFTGKHIEVALEEDQRMTHRHTLGLSETNTSFKIRLDGRDKTLQAMVRPKGCRDCKDFKHFQEECYLSYSTSSIVRVKASALTAVLSASPSRIQQLRTSPVTALLLSGGPTGSNNTRAQRRKRKRDGDTRHAQHPQPHHGHRSRCRDCCRHHCRCRSYMAYSR